MLGKGLCWVETGLRDRNRTGLREEAAEEEKQERAASTFEAHTVYVCMSI